MSKSLAETAKLILEGGNADSLKPKSKHADPEQTLGSATVIADAPKKPGEGSNVGAAAAAPIKGGNAASLKPKSKHADAPAHLEEDEAVEGEVVAEEDIELSEELQAFIDAMIAEGASEDEIAAAIEENFELVSEEAEEDIFEEDAAETEEETIEEEAEEEVEETVQIDMSEHVNALLEGESLSEEFKAKATTIFEAAVKTKLDEEVAIMETAYAEALEENTTALIEQLEAQVDDYLNYVIEQWMSENEVAIEAGLRTELTEDFIGGLRQLFAENFIDIPEDKVNVLEEMGNKVEELEAKLNEEIERNVELTKVLNESKKELVVGNMIEGLTSAQAEKLKELVETVEFTGEEEFADKVKTLRESYFPTTAVKAQTELDSVEATDGKSMIQEELTGPMARYVRTLGKKLPN